MSSILTQTLPSGFSFDMIFVKGGVFDMGGSGPDALDREKPVHRVEVPTCYMGKYPVTQALWETVTGAENNPSVFKGEGRPVENISWNDTKDFLKQLNKQTGKNFRLPTEAEWEYAALGGKHSLWYRYAGSDKLKQVGWFTENSGGQTKDVGLLLANELGLHDMSGNVWEWCEDDWHDSYKGSLGDGSAWVDEPDRGARRVIRGGSSFDGSQSCRPSSRSRGDPTLPYTFVGFRLVLPFQSGG